MSELRWTPSVRDKGKVLTCRAYSPLLHAPPLSDSWTLEVNCESQIHVKYIHIVLLYTHKHTHAHVQVEFLAEFPGSRRFSEWELREVISCSFMEKVKWVETYS